MKTPKERSTDEITARCHKLEAKIARLLQKYEEACDVKVDHITVTRCACSQCHCVNVDITLDY